MSAPNPGFLYMLGHYRVSIVVHHFDRDLVASWLPEDMELAPQDIAPPGKHPANLLFGFEERVGFNLACGLPFMNYREFGLVIPFTQWKHKQFAYNGPFLFTPIIFVDSELVSLGGGLVYGFPKRIAKFSANDQRYSALDKEVLMPYAEAEFQSLGTEPSAKGRDTIWRLIQQPSISHKATGEYMGSGFWWGLENAKFTNLDAKGKIVRYLLPGVADGEHPFEAHGADDFTNGGAYHMITDWTLTWPGPITKDWSPWDRSGGV